MKKNLQNYLIFLILAGLLYMPLFGHLGNKPIRIYDEGRLAMNALQMMENGNFIVTHFDDKPDMWNTKPPFLIWNQVLLMKILGPDELAVRLPSAIAAFLTCLLILMLGMRYLKQPWYGFTAVLVLITSQGYITEHATRTGDYDAMLTLFTTLSGIFLFLYTENRDKRYLYLFFTALALGVLTKSISGLMFLPAMVIWILIRKEMVPLLTSRHFYFSLVIFLVLVPGYYLLRESMNPGYFQAVIDNELGGRFSEVVEGHAGGFWFYYDNFRNIQIVPYFLLIPCGMFAGFFVKEGRLRRLTLFSTLMVFTWFLVISTAKTKLWWYDVPMYPFFAIIISSFLFLIFEALRNYGWFSSVLKYNVVPFLFLFLIFVTPYEKIIGKTYLPQENPDQKDFYEPCNYLKKGLKGEIDLRGQNLVYVGYNPQYLFYGKAIMMKDPAFQISHQDHLEAGDVVIIFQKDVAQYVENIYNFEKIGSWGNTIVTYKIHGRRTP